MHQGANSDFPEPACDWSRDAIAVALPEDPRLPLSVLTEALERHFGAKLKRHYGAIHGARRTPDSGRLAVRINRIIEPTGTRSYSACRHAASRKSAPTPKLMRF